jgi:hypothetical protein
MYQCPDHHSSETPDFCSVCGVEIAKNQPAPASASSSENCPQCGAPRESGRQVFCEGCGFNYHSRVPTPATSAPVTNEPEREVATAQLPAAAQVATTVRWDVIAKVDANLYGKPNPDAPVKQPAQTFTLFDTENMIGRADSGVRVQVPIKDAGVSRRQALLIRQPDGGLILRDLGSANGTQLNGVEVTPGVDNPLKDGDTIAIGAWTRLAVRAVPS